MPATAAVAVQGASNVVEALTPADILLYVEAGTASRDKPVRAESSPRFVVRSISPTAVRLAAPCEALTRVIPIMATLFGTDGIRGEAGSPPLDPETIARVGAALVRVHGGAGRRVLIGRDTRESGTWIESALTRGLAGDGAEVDSAGVVPTPAIAYLTKAGGFDLGVVISASHNPYRDNGIKVFSGAGEKFTEAEERAVEAMVADGSWSPAGSDAQARPRPDLVDRYLTHLRRVLPDAGRLRGSRLVVDCANGATSGQAPALFRDLGFEVEAIGVDPDGRNINAGCGSTAMEAPPGAGAGGRGPAGRGLRRRRRSGAVRRSPRPSGRWRRGDADVRRAAAPRRPAHRRRHRRHRDEQHRPRAGAQGSRGGAGALPGRRQVRDGGDAEARPRPGRRTVGPCHLRRSPLHRRRHGDRPARAAHDGRDRRRARRAGRRADGVSRRCW